MKKKMNVFSTVICAITLITLFGCQNPAENNTGNNDNTAAKQTVYDKFLGTWKNIPASREFKFSNTEIWEGTMKTTATSVNDVILSASEFTAKTNFTQISFESSDINQCGILAINTGSYYGRLNFYTFYKYRFINDTQCFLQYLGRKDGEKGEFSLENSSRVYTKQTGGGSGEAGGIDFTISGRYTVNEAQGSTTVSFSSNTWTATKNTVLISGSYTQTDDSLQVTYEKNGYSQTETFTITGTADTVMLTLSTAGTASVILGEWGIVGTSVTLTR